MVLVTEELRKKADKRRTFSRRYVDFHLLLHFYFPSVELAGQTFYDLIVRRGIFQFWKLGYCIKIVAIRLHDLLRIKMRLFLNRLVNLNIFQMVIISVNFDMLF